MDEYLGGEYLLDLAQELLPVERLQDDVNVPIEDAVCVETPIRAGTIA